MSESSFHSIEVELAVNICDSEDVDKLENLLKQTEGLKILNLDPHKKTVTLDFSQLCSSSISDILTNIENNTGITSVVKGIGNSFSAVAELRPANINDKASNESNIFGVIRLSQLGNKCYIDGLIDGFVPQVHGKIYSAIIHQYGDLSGNDYENIGPPLLDINKNLEIFNGKEDAKKAVSFKTVLDDCQLMTLIGRALAVSETDQDDKSSKCISAGIISRASTVNGNGKQICACSGKTIWQERMEKMSE